MELGWERPRTQMSGRTAGDLITVFDLPGGVSEEELIGRIVTVRVTGAAPLLLRGDLDARGEVGARPPLRADRA